jgi:mycothiol synthase
MNLQSRPYREPDDLRKMKALVVEGRKVSPHSGYWHIGVLDWWLYYGAYKAGRDLEDVIILWEDSDRLMGWVLLEAPEVYDLVVHPSLRGTEIEAYIHAETAKQLRAALKEDERLRGVFLWADELALRESLTQQGYVGADFLIYFTQSLDKPLPTPLLPEGFSFIEAMQPEWVDRRADLHVHAFDESEMTGADYAHFMTAPNYDPTLDVVIVAPDGTFAAYAMAWIDPGTGIGDFEPVGTRDTMQRKGLGKAAVLEGLRRMQALGMTIATVLTHIDDAGNIAFYESIGYQKTNVVMLYEKK